MRSHLRENLTTIGKIREQREEEESNSEAYLSKESNPWRTSMR
jgi:hypothetical protein